jgi:hypothetical protein
MSTRIRLAASLFAILLIAACTEGRGAGSSPSSTGESPSVQESPSSVPTGPGSAAAALAKLCVQPSSTPSSEVPAEGPTPPAIARVEQQVEQLRDLRFTQRVAIDPLTHAQLVKGLAASFDTSYPAALYRRRSLAWQVIGAIPEGVSIRRSLESFMSTQVIGYYDTQSHELAFIGTRHPTGVERDTLAHELTHALDDQHFGLNRLDSLSSSCKDEAFDAALALVEGDATYVQIRYAQDYLTAQEQLQLINQPVPSTEGIPPFIVQLENWPYMAGFTFVVSLVQQGGERAVDRAFERLPVSTEQIIHPDLYPADVPQPVDVPDIAPELGAGWSDLDVQQVGEEWLSLLLGLRIDQSSAASAAAGWDGGIYRAWSDGVHVAVVMSTVWDTTGDATEFARTVQRWIDAGTGTASVLPAQGSGVRVLFASDPATLSVLEAAAGR